MDQGERRHPTRLDEELLVIDNPFCSPEEQTYLDAVDANLRELLATEV